MRLLVPERRFDPANPEMMDRPDVDPGLLEEDLRNLRTINRFLGGLRAVRKHILAFFDRVPPGRQLRILDLAAGSGDHALSLVRLGHSLGRPVRITAVDRNPVMIQIARNLTSGFSEIEIRQADILDLRDEGWESDVVLCSLALHHFSGEDAIRVLETMNRLSALGFIVNELNRHWFAAWCGWTYAHLTTRNPITRNDTYVSFLRAFTSSELASMARRAGVAYFQIHHEPMFRLVLVGEH